jgi:hypothetical protein
MRGDRCDESGVSQSLNIKRNLVGLLQFWMCALALASFITRAGNGAENAENARRLL